MTVMGAVFSLFGYDSNTVIQNYFKQLQKPPKEEPKTKRLQCAEMLWRVERCRPFGPKPVKTVRLFKHHKVCF